MTEDWFGDLEVWLTPFLAALRQKTRMRLCPARSTRSQSPWPGIDPAQHAELLRMLERMVANLTASV